MAAGQGLEPRQPGPEPGVLPLDDPATASGLLIRVEDLATEIPTLQQVGLSCCSPRKQTRQTLQFLTCQ